MLISFYCCSVCSPKVLSKNQTSKHELVKIPKWSARQWWSAWNILIVLLSCSFHIQKRSFFLEYSLDCRGVYDSCYFFTDILTKIHSNRLWIENTFGFSMHLYCTWNNLSICVKWTSLHNLYCSHFWHIIFNLMRLNSSEFSLENVVLFGLFHDFFLYFVYKI